MFQNTSLNVLCVSAYDVNAFLRWDAIGLTISNSKYNMASEYSVRAVVYGRCFAPAAVLTTSSHGRS